MTTFCLAPNLYLYLENNISEGVFSRKEKSRDRLVEIEFHEIDWWTAQNMYTSACLLSTINLTMMTGLVLFPLFISRLGHKETRPKVNVYWRLSVEYVYCFCFS